MSKTSGPLSDRSAGVSAACQSGIETSLNLTLMLGYSLLNAALAPFAVAVSVGLQPPPLTVPDVAGPALCSWLAAWLCSAPLPPPPTGAPHAPRARARLATPSTASRPKHNL